MNPCRRTTFPLSARKRSDQKPRPRHPHAMLKYASNRTCSGCGPIGSANASVGFDLEKLLGVNCQVQVVQDISEDSRIFANVQAIVPAPRNVPKLTAQEYVRQKDRPTNRQNGSNNGAMLTADDVPV